MCKYHNKLYDNKQVQDINSENIKKNNIKNIIKEKNLIRKKEEWSIIRKQQLSGSTENNYLNNINVKKEKKVLNSYKYKSLSRGIEWELSNEDALLYFNNKCYYCGEYDINKLVGIDRKINEQCYTKDNCVSCCSMCNNMKKCLDWHIFIKRCEHMATYNNIYIGKLCYDAYSDYGSVSYNEYKLGASKRNVEFNLTKKEFNKIVQKLCYLCGKQNTDTHQNGCDRIDNTKGYNIDNCKACCSQCNFMKHDYPYDILINKCKKIAETHKNILNTIEINKQNDNFNIFRNEFRKKNNLKI
jgi:hypothetical protein